MRTRPFFIALTTAALTLSRALPAQSTRAVRAARPPATDAAAVADALVAEPSLDAVRRATDRFRDVKVALAAAAEFITFRLGRREGAIEIQEL